MRRAFAEAMISIAGDENFYFLSGDLGFMALEEVRTAFGSRFINAGISEQNMVGVAAGLAKTGCRPFIYSIAPFCYARPFEQIRNDLCLSDLPVCLVGNGGGYAYGHMGPTHHALEDCAAMAALGLGVLVPAFDEDIATLTTKIDGPTYLRLGYDVRPRHAEAPQWAPFRRLLDGSAGTLVALGPLSGLAWSALLEVPLAERPTLWAACELPLQNIPEAFWKAVEGRKLYVLEEHIAQGGLGMQLSLEMIKRGIHPSHFVHRPALGYPNNRFGSQAFHRAQCGFDEAGVLDMVRNSK